MDIHRQKTGSIWIFLIAILPWTFIHPGMTEEKFAVTIIGREEASIPEHKNELFSRISSVDIDENGNIYILDGRESTVKVFEAKGTFIRNLFRQGEGPGEISHPFKVKWNRFRKTLFILDQFGNSLKEFSPDGKELKKYPLPEQMVNFFSFSDQNHLCYFRKSQDRKSYSISQYDFPGNLHSDKISIGIPVTQEGGLPGFLVVGDKIWFCPEDRMELVAYSLKEGRKTDDIPLPEEYRPLQVVKTAAWIMTVVFQYGMPVLFDGELHILVFHHHYSSDSFRTLADGEAEKTSIRLYRLQSGRLEKRADLGSHEGIIDPGFVHNRRLAFIHNSPFPQVRILDLR